MANKNGSSSMSSEQFFQQQAQSEQQKVYGDALNQSYEGTKHAQTVPGASPMNPRGNGTPQQLSPKNYPKEFVSSLVQERLNKIDYNHLTPEAKAYFARQSIRCQICGQPMEPYTDPAWTGWERKWSVHRPCAQAVENQLDRKTGVLSERNARAKRK